MGRKPKGNTRLFLAVSFACGILVTIATRRSQGVPNNNNNNSNLHAGCVSEQVVCRHSSLSSFAGTQFVEQKKFCVDNQHPQALANLQTAGFSYVRHDGIQPALGTAGYNMSMWVYDGTDIVSNAIRATGMWESHETHEIMSKLLFVEQVSNLEREEVFFVDIGANVGWFTINAAAMGYSVIAFEPTTPNAYAIRHTLCGFPLMQSHVALVNKGLSDRAETCSVVASKENLGDGHVQCNVDPSAEPAAGMVVHGQFELTTLDNYFRPAMQLLKDKVAVVKVDVEGFEDKVFKGADSFMTMIQPKYILCEFHGTFSQGTSAEDMLLMFHNWGYVVHTDRFDGPVEPRDGFNTLAERTGADKAAINLYFTR